MYIYYIFRTYPQPDPPTIAIFLPLEIVKLISLKIGLSLTYWKLIFLNSIFELFELILNFIAFSLDWY